METCVYFWVVASDACPSISLIEREIGAALEHVGGARVAKRVGVEVRPARSERAVATHEPVDLRRASSAARSSRTKTGRPDRAALAGA